MSFGYISNGSHIMAVNDDRVPRSLYPGVHLGVLFCVPYPFDSSNAVEAISVGFPRLGIHAVLLSNPLVQPISYS